MLVSGAEAVDVTVSVAVGGDAIVGVVVLVDAVVAVAMMGVGVMGGDMVGEDGVVGVALNVAEKLSSGVRSDWSCFGVVGGDFDESTKSISEVSSGMPSEVGVAVTRAAKLVEWILAVDRGVEGERSEDWKRIGREEGEGTCCMRGGVVVGSELMNNVVIPNK